MKEFADARRPYCYPNEEGKLTRGKEVAGYLKGQKIFRGPCMCICYVSLPFSLMKIKNYH